MRSYMPLQFWIASGEINVLKKLIELQVSFIILFYNEFTI